VLNIQHALVMSEAF